MFSINPTISALSCPPTIGKYIKYISFVISFMYTSSILKRTLFTFSPLLYTSSTIITICSIMKKKSYLLIAFFNLSVRFIFAGHVYMTLSFFVFVTCMIPHGFILASWLSSVSFILSFRPAFIMAVTVDFFMLTFNLDIRYFPFLMRYILSYVKILFSLLLRT